MADNNTPIGDSTENTEKVSAALQPDDGAVIPRISLKETGFSALKVTSVGRIVEEAQQQFRSPNMYKVVYEMNYSPAIATGMNALNTLICSAEPRIKPLPDENEVDKERRYFLQSIFGDMDNSFQSTMQGIVTYMKFGYQVSEMVFRRRLKRNGSVHDDGLVGLKGLKNRPQNSIRYWTFSEDGRELVSISQTLENMPNSYRFAELLNEQGCITIPREKFILFRCDPVDDNPEGRSVLQAAYLPYKQLTLLTDHLMTGAAKDLGGIPFAQLPPKYMDPEASPADKAVYTSTQELIKNLYNGQSTGIIFPKMIDPDSKADLFSFSVLEQKTGNSYDIESVIKTLQANILSVLGCGSVTMSAADAGSFSTQDSNTNILALTVKYRLEEISSELNKTLIPKLWQIEWLGYIAYA